MKCCLHIGTEKTGTTTIQAFFAQNRDRFSAKGVYYLRSIGLPNNRKLSLAAYNRSRRDDFTRTLKIDSDNALKEFQDKIIRDFKNELKDLPQDAKVFCSNEHIQSRLTTIEEVSRLKEILSDAGLRDVNVILYLRNPAEIANSLYSTSIKGGGTGRSVPPPDNPYYNNICNHKQTVERFSSVFGVENMTLRLFRKDKLVNGSLIDDILNAISCNDESLSEFNVPPNQNESLSALGIQILRSLNEIIPAFTASGRNKSQLELQALIVKHLSKPKYAMAKELYSAYDTFFMESNEWVRRNFFPEESRLFENSYPEESQTGIPEESIQNLSRLIADIWHSKQQKLST